MPASSKAAPPQQSKLEEAWGGKKKRKAEAVEVKDESSALDKSGEQLDYSPCPRQTSRTRYDAKLGHKLTNRGPGDWLGEGIASSSLFGFPSCPHSYSPLAPPECGRDFAACTFYGMTWWPMVAHGDLVRFAGQSVWHALHG